MSNKTKQPSPDEVMERLIREYFRQAPQVEVRRQADAPRQ